MKGIVLMAVLTGLTGRDLTRRYISVAMISSTARAPSTPSVIYRGTVHTDTDNLGQLTLDNPHG